MKKLIIVILFTTTLITSFISAQNKIDSSFTPHFSMYLRNLNLSMTTILLQNDVTLSSDINLIDLKSGYIGLQPGVSFLTVTGLFSTVMESPFVDYNLLGIFSTPDQRNLFFQFMYGYVYRTSASKIKQDYPFSMAKYGFTLGWNTSKYIKLYLKFSQIKGKPDYKGSAAGFGIAVRLYNYGTPNNSSEPK